MEIRPILPQLNIQPAAVSRENLRRPAEKMAGDEFAFGARMSDVCLKKINSLTLEKYRQMSFFEKLKLRLITPFAIKRDAKANFYAARSAKNYLDHYYGTGNYTAIIIGRSMASVGETMRLIGRDVRILPMSNLADGMPKNIENVDVYRKFLESVNLTREIIENNPKHNFLLIDYVSSGASLKNAHKFLSRPDLLGNPDRFTPISSQMLLGFNGIMASCLDCLFMLSRFKKYSPIGQLPLTKLNKVFERLQPDPYYEKERGLFLFETMRRVDKYMKKTGR